ncbi:GNAT family N-acetyltransferase [Pontibacter sp. SGAir0037]|uniref:GNAT family N-acetyltransferase n=1 Tax=Pontibacter sp. SGAir0037 TaxID=2571030 RepID=UPI0010CD4C10|nr:GNAT family N-acetyltransferase [Pontibacter sp. SGAir0037]QCR21092.1 hypothetical protein C1N53_01065 [Pontibacter sp. SGAir0037]
MIKEADADDIDELFELWCELQEDHQGYHPVFKVKPNSQQVLKDELLYRMRDKDTRFFAYTDGSEWLGMMVVSLKKASEGFKLSRKGYIGETIVKKEARSKGIGKELFEAARNWLSDRGADHIELQVSVKNNRGLSFWQDLGFTPTTYHMILDVKK